MNLTIAEIKDLAEFCGLVLKEGSKNDTEQDDAEMVIVECPETGVKDDDGVARRYAHIAYSYDYPEEGCMPLGPELHDPEQP